MPWRAIDGTDLYREPGNERQSDGEVRPGLETLFRGVFARELVEKVRNSVSVDWTQRENARAQIRVMVKRILRKYGYPPDKQAHATELVLDQASVLCHGWAAE